MDTFHLVIFLIKFVVVIVTFSFAIYRVQAFRTVLPIKGRPSQSFFRTTTVNYNSQFQSQQAVRAMSTDTSTTSTIPKKEFIPSQVILDQATGEKWRLCAGVAVLNSKNQLLVGERQGTPDSWQCPQGGVDDEWTTSSSSPSPDGSNQAHSTKPKETIVEAAIRELYEEIGLIMDKHVILDSTFPTPSLNESSSNTGVRYSTQGSSNWLSEAGLAGQELHWTVFRCMDGRGDEDPNEMCDLSGKGGEKAEFTRVEWRNVKDVVQGIWPGKRAPYLALESLLEVHGHQWQEQVQNLDFSGIWERDASQSSHLVEGLLARGLTSEQAQQQSTSPYIQRWERDGTDPTKWLGSTYDNHGTTVRRRLEYPVGTWEEKYQGESTLFGNSPEPITLTRRTSYVGEADANPVRIAHVTITNSPKGIEESRRYRKDGILYLRRAFWPKEALEESPIVSTEVFLPRRE